MIYIFVRVGSIHETPRLGGISHCVEHMIFKSSEKYDTKDILKTLTLVGNMYNATTNRDLTNYFIHTTSEGARWKDATRLLMSMVFTPKIDEKEWKREKNVVLQELYMTAEQEHTEENIFKTLISHKHPYAYPVGGTYESVRNLTAKDLQEHHRRFYFDPERVSIVVSCPHKLKTEVKSLFTKICCSWPVQSIRVPDNIPPIDIEPSIQFKNRSSAESVTIYMTFPTYNVREWKKLAAQNLLMNCLTESALYSILMYELREKRGLVYSIRSDTETYDHMSINKIKFSTHKPDKILYIIGKIMRVINTIKNVGLEGKTFRFYKESYINSLKYLMTRHEYYFLISAFNHNYGVEHVSRKKYMDWIERLSNQDIVQAARDTFNFTKMGLYIEGNLKHVNRDSIKQFHTKTSSSHQQT